MWNETAKKLAVGKKTYQILKNTDRPYIWNREFTVNTGTIQLKLPRLGFKTWKSQSKSTDENLLCITLC